MSYGAQKHTPFWPPEADVSGVFLYGLHAPFCCGGPNCCQHVGMKGWPLAWLIAMSGFVLLLQGQGKPLAQLVLNPSGM